MHCNTSNHFDFFIIEKAKAFLMFSGGIENEQLEMDKCIIFAIGAIIESKYS